MSDDITNNAYYNNIKSSNDLLMIEYVYNHINYFVTLVCEYMLNKSLNKKNLNKISNVNDMFQIDHFFIEKYNINLTNKLTNSIQ